MKTNKPTEEWKRKNGVTPKDGEKLKFAKKNEQMLRKKGNNIDTIKLCWK